MVIMKHRRPAAKHERIAPYSMHFARCRSPESELQLEIVWAERNTFAIGLHQQEALRDQVFGIDHWIGVGVGLHGIVTAILRGFGDRE